MAETNAQRAVRLRQEYEDAKRAAIQDLLEKRKQIDAELEEMGYEPPKRGPKPKKKAL